MRVKGRGFGPGHSITVPTAAPRAGDWCVKNGSFHFSLSKRTPHSLSLGCNHWEAPPPPTTTCLEYQSGRPNPQVPAEEAAHPLSSKGESHCPRPSSPQSPRCRASRRPRPSSCSSSLRPRLPLGGSAARLFPFEGRGRAGPIPAYQQQEREAADAI